MRRVFVLWRWRQTHKHRSDILIQNSTQGHSSTFCCAVKPERINIFISVCRHCYHAKIYIIFIIFNDDFYWNSRIELNLFSVKLSNTWHDFVWTWTRAGGAQGRAIYPFMTMVPFCIKCLVFDDTASHYLTWPDTAVTLHLCWCVWNHSVALW